MELLDVIGYQPALVQQGSPLEMVPTIFTTALEIDETGHLTNHDVTHRRAAQWIWHCCDPSYEFDHLLQPGEHRTDRSLTCRHHPR
ncbi:MAG: hypothetical protein JWN00_5295 [Actinomycetia bacterium]|nr:hypothetical protein [Actinomycetes bacterium]